MIDTLIRASYVDKNLVKRQIEGSPYEILSIWANNHFYCRNLINFELIEHIKSVCNFKFKKNFLLDEQTDIDVVSLDMLNRLKQHGVKIDFKEFHNEHLYK